MLFEQTMKKVGVSSVCVISQKSKTSNIHFYFKLRYKNYWCFLYFVFLMF